MLCNTSFRRGLLLYFACGALAAQAAELEYRDGRVSARFEHKPVQEVLGRIEQTLPLEVRVREALDGPPVTAQFERLPMTEALEALLAGYSYVLVNAQGSDKARLTVLGRSQAAQTPTEPPIETPAEAAATPAEAEPTLLPPVAVDPATGAELTALRALLAGGETTAASAALERLMAHADPAVRAQAAQLWQQGAAASGGIEPDAQRRETLRRMQQVEELAQDAGPAARARLASYLHDPDPAVRDLAQDLLETNGAGGVGPDGP